MQRERDRLILQIERALVSQAHLRRLLATAKITLTEHQQDLRTVEARIKRTTLRGGV
jgi:hypothetical protein